MQISYWTRKFFNEIRKTGEVITGNKDIFREAVIKKVKMKLSLYPSEIGGVIECFNELYFTNIENG